MKNKDQKQLDCWQSWQSLKTLIIIKSYIIMQKKLNYINNQIVKLQIVISAREIFDKKAITRSDSYVNVYFKQVSNQAYHLLGRTETIHNDSNPNFKTSLTVDYTFETRQKLLFKIMNEDDIRDSNYDKFIGSVQTTLGDIAGSKDQTQVLVFNNPNQNNIGKVILRAQTCENGIPQNVRMKWGAISPANNDGWFDWEEKNNLYLKFFKITKDNLLVEAGRTSVAKNDLEPSWNPIDIHLDKLVRGDDEQQKFKLECWNRNQQTNNKQQFVGEAYFWLPELLQARDKLQFQLTNRRMWQSASVILEEISLQSLPTLFDYLRGGLHLNLSVAIDFTASNKNSTSSSSLHTMNKQAPNQYQSAITAIGNIILSYSYKKLIPAFGFGAKINFPYLKTKAASHCFPLSGDSMKTQAQGIEELMNMYANVFKCIDPSEPKYFAPIIQNFIDTTQQSRYRGGLNYQIMLILTSGQINDMDQTIDLLFRFCHLPISIIIVGIGNANFDKMKALDGKNGLFNNKGVRATRQYVRFVAFNDLQMNPDLLSKELLADLPKQILQYMAIVGKMPKKPNYINIETMLTENHKTESTIGNLKINMPKSLEGITVNPQSKEKVR